MSELLFRTVTTTECQVSLLGDDDRIPPLPAHPDPFPEVQVGPGGLVVTTRCPDYGEVEIELWAGDPGLRADGWDVLFEGLLETGTGGFELASVGILFFRLGAPAGTHNVRVEARRDGQWPWFMGVRFVFPDSPTLQESR